MEKYGVRMDGKTRGVAFGLVSSIAVCGAIFYWLEHARHPPFDFIERYLGFSPDGGDGSFEVMLLITVGVLIVATAFHLTVRKGSCCKTSMSMSAIGP